MSTATPLTARPPMPPGPVGGPGAWRGADLARSDAWIRRFSPAEIAELEAARAEVERRRLPLLEVGAAEFPLPTLAPALQALRRELLHGRGFALLRGLPIERYALPQVATIYWGLGAHLGRPVSQNAQGHLLGHVTDVGRDLADPTTRVYQTRLRQGYHTDSVDLVALLCLRRARAGGLSSLVSSVTAHDELWARHPDLLPALFEPFAVDRRGEVPAGQKPWFELAVYHWHAGHLSAIYHRGYIESARRFPGAPPLTPRRRAALDALDQVLEDEALVLRMDFEPGDIQILHNHQVFHDRTAYEDWDEPARKRHLLRLWLCPPDGRPLPPAYAQRYGSVTPGARGGIVVPGTRLCVPPAP